MGVGRKWGTLGGRAVGFDASSGAVWRWAVSVLGWGWVLSVWQGSDGAGSGRRKEIPAWIDVIKRACAHMMVVASRMWREEAAMVGVMRRVFVNGIQM